MIEVESLVVRSYDFRETSLIVDMISKEIGSIRVLVKGARDPKKGWTSYFLPLSYIKAVLYPGKNLYLLGNAEMIGYFPYIKENMYRFSVSTSLLEVSYLISPPPHESLFAFLIESLNFINKEKFDLLLLPVYLWLKVLSFSGFNPELRRCVSCGRKEDISFYSVELGGVLCKKCKSKSNDIIEVDKQFLGFFNSVSQISFNRMSRINVSLSQKKKLKEIVYRHLLYRLESKPPTLRFLEKNFVNYE